jgi:malonyl-CoA O-methyltransferase
MNLSKVQIAHQFSRAASTYDNAAQLQNEMAEKLIGAMPARITGTLVDLGCGTGWALNKLAQKNRFELIGIDIAPGMIEIAQARVPTAQFHCCDLEETPLESKMADVVFSNAALQWCDVEAAIREMHRICKPEGNVVFSTFGPKTLGEIQSAWRTAGDQVDRIHQFKSAGAIKSIMQRIGFETIRIVPVERKSTYNTVDALLRSLKQLGATNASVSRQTGLLGTKRFRSFRDVFETQLERDGHLELTFECIFAVAEKR